MNTATYYHPGHGADTAPRPAATDLSIICGGGCGEQITEIPYTPWGRREYVTGGNVDPIATQVRS